MVDALRLPRLFAACAAALWFAACSFGLPSPDRPDDGERGSVTVHTWRAIDAAPMQPWSGPRTALYTYLLVGDIGSPTQPTNAATERAWRALGQLLKEVQAGESIGDAARWPPEVLARANQFCVPATSAATARIEPGDYDLDRSREYLNLFRLALQANDGMLRSLDGLGPFFIATRKPVAEIVARDAQGALAIDTASPILLVDMTGQNELAMPEYVLAFRQTVRNEVANSTTVKPLRAKFASLVLDLNAALPIVAEAYAGTKKMFE